MFGEAILWAPAFSRQFRQIAEATQKTQVGFGDYRTVTKVLFMRLM